MHGAGGALPPATATPAQLACGQGTRPAVRAVAAFTLRCWYCSSSSTLSSSVTSASRLQHQSAASGAAFPPPPSPAGARLASRRAHCAQAGSPWAWQMGHRMGKVQDLHAWHREDSLQAPRDHC
jgi:hypothetical protein